VATSLKDIPSAISGSESNYRQAGDQLKMASIESCHCISKMQSCRTDQQIRQRNNHAFCRLFPRNPPGELGKFERQGVNRYCVDQLLDEGAPPLAINVRPSAVYSVGSFHYGDCRKRTLSFPLGSFRTFENVPDVLSLPLTCNQEARIKNQSHAGGVSGLRWLSNDFFQIGDEFGA
jgi:hypothetical protein